MKRTININLAGKPFTIDEDAYDHVEQYLARLSRHFYSTEGSDNIMFDIESRLAELLEEQKKASMIVDIEHVEAAIQILGQPEDFGARTTFGDAPETGEYRTGRKLFRDPDDKVVAGVCSGLAAYFGIDNALWIRLAFAFMFVMFGSGLFLYILMAVLIPKAKTSSDFLAMKGEPINICSIAEQVERNIDHITDQLSDIRKDLRKKK